MEREDSSVGLVMMDIDRFKSINDTYGHLVGDEVLKESSRRLNAACRAYDSVGRYGGEEFLIILPGCHTQCIHSHAERLRQAIADEPMRIGNLELRVSASFGATYALPSFDAPSEGLIRIADTALYQAKREGRDCVRVIRYEASQDGQIELDHQLVSTKIS